MKCEICGSEFENFHAQGFDNKIYCPLCYFKKENQELKQKYENAVSDYETAMFEKEQLKKQLENKYKKVGTLTSELLYEENTKLINQQKEFIKWLENYLELFDYDNINYDMIEEILQKYKSIIGENDV